MIFVLIEGVGCLESVWWDQAGGVRPAFAIPLSPFLGASLTRRSKFGFLFAYKDICFHI